MPRINDDTHRFWDLMIKALASVAFIGPLVFGYFQSLRTASLEARKPYLQRQLDLCVEAANAAGTIATAPKPEVVADAKATFNRPYWGTRHLRQRPSVKGDGRVQRCCCRGETAGASSTPCGGRRASVQRSHEG
jgi:hypothetical protein